MYQVEIRETKSCISRKALPMNTRYFCFWALRGETAFFDYRSASVRVGQRANGKEGRRTDFGRENGGMESCLCDVQNVARQKLPDKSFYFISEASRPIRPNARCGQRTRHT